MNQEIIDKHFLRIAWLTAINLSKDPSTQVGACVTSEDSRQLSLGFNGFPAGITENKTVWQREFKYERVVHAEINAIINSPFDTKGCTIYCTHQPCHRCLGLIVNARIKRLVYNEGYIGLSTNLDVWDETAKENESIEEIVHYSLPDEFVTELRANRDKFKLISLL